MNSFRLKKAMFLLLLVSTIFAGCQTKANHARSLVNQSCNDLGIPSEIIVKGNERIVHQGKEFILRLRYNYSLSYSKKLTECISAYQCSQMQTDRLFECQKERSIFQEFVFGRSSCSLPEIDC